MAKSVEVAALDVLHRAHWRPVSRDMVDAWFSDRSRHPGACPCWRCQAAAKVNPCDAAEQLGNDDEPQT